MLADAGKGARQVSALNCLSCPYAVQSRSVPLVIMRHIGAVPTVFGSIRAHGHANSLYTNKKIVFGVLYACKGHRMRAPDRQSGLSVREGVDYLSRH